MNQITHQQRNIPKLRFTGFTKGWEEKKIGEIAEVKGGKRIPKGHSLQITNNGIPYITVSDMRDGSVSLENIRYVPEAIENIIKNYKISTKDIYISVAGTLGLVGIIPAKLDGANLTENANKLTNIKCNQHFLFQQLKSDNFGKLVNSVKTDNAQPKLAIYAIKNFRIFIPDYEEQQQIADFLNVVDEKISKMQKKVELLKKYKKGVMQKIFSQKIRFKDVNGKDYPDWKFMTLSDFLVFTPREVPKPNSNFLSIGVRSHFRGTFQKKDFDPKDIDMDKLYVVKDGDLIVNITFGWEGAVAIVNKEDDGGLVSHRFPTFEFNENKVLRDYFRFIFPNDRFKYDLGLASPGGAGRNRVLNKKDFLEISFKFPSILEQKKIAEYLLALETEINLEERKLEQAKRFKKSLLQQMFI